MKERDLVLKLLSNIFNKYLFDKKRLFLYLILFAIQISKGQDFPNENYSWINFNKEYLKITVQEEGIYRISFEDLMNAGFTDINKNPQNFEIYYRGKPIPLAINGEEDGKFDNNDFIQFYAKKNDGIFDGLVYKPINSKPNPYFNIFTEETNYFLTFSDKKGKRVEKIVKDETLEYTTNSNLRQNMLISFNSDWNFDYYKSTYPTLQQSFFESDELYCGKVYGMHFNFPDNTFSLNTKLYNLAYKNNSPVSVNIEQFITSRQQKSKVVTSKINDKVFNLNLQNFSSKLLKTEFNLFNTDSLKFQTYISQSLGSNAIQNDRFSISYIKIDFPVLNNLKTGEYIFNSDQNENFRLNFKNPDNINIKDLEIFEISDIYSVKKLVSIIENDSISIFFNKIKNAKIYVNSEYKKPKKIKVKRFENINFENFNYFIIYNNVLKNSVKNYQDFRQSVAGGNFKVKSLEIEEIFDMFLFGEKNPVAINIMANSKFNKQVKPNVLIIGRAMSYPSYFTELSNLDLVPSIGFPASDFLLIQNQLNNLALAKIGRIPAINDLEVNNYLEKVKLFEKNSVNQNFWQKRIASLSGGKTEAEIIDFKNFMNSLGQEMSKSYLGSYNLNYSKNAAETPYENIDLSNEFNNGIGLLTFFGHSSAKLTDLNFGYASDPKKKINNSPNFPFMVFNGCGAGNVFFTDEALTKDWLLTADRGAIGIIAHSYLSFSSTNKSYMKKFFNYWLGNKENFSLTIGDVHGKVNEDIIKNSKEDLLNSFELANVHQMVLQGDPAIRIFNMTKPDFQTEDDKLFLTSIVKNKAVADGDSLKLGVMISNYGIYELGTTVNLNIKKTYTDGKTTDQQVKIKAIAYQDTLFVNLKKDLNLKSLSVSVDNDLKVDEMDETNNSARINFNWEALKNTSYYSTATLVDIVNPNLEVKLEGKLPVDGMNVAQGSILEVDLTDENSFGNKTDKLEVKYRKICDKCPETLTKLDLGNISGEPNEIISKINLKDLSLGLYEVFIQGYDAKKNSSGDVFTFTFNIIDETKPTSVKVYPNPMSLYTTFEIAVSQKNALTKADFSINIYNQMGVFVKTINGDLKQGLNDVYWDAKDNSGNSLPSGQYFYKMVINKNGEIENKGGKIRIFP